MEKSAVPEHLDDRPAKPLRELTEDELALVCDGIFGGILLDVLTDYVSDCVKEAWHWLQNRICRGQH